MEIIVVLTCPGNGCCCRICCCYLHDRGWKIDRWNCGIDCGHCLTGCLSGGYPTGCRMNDCLNGCCCFRSDCHNHCDHYGW